MHFINSNFLFFIPLVFIPFIIHFLFFKKQKKELFSSLFLIKRAYLKNRNIIRFKKYLIFMLRFLIVLLLVAAFAKPVIKTNKFISKIGVGASGEESVKLLILIDRSYSTRYLSSGKTVYDVAAGAALKILQSLGKKDKAAVAFFSEEMETKRVNWSNDFSSLENIIKASKPGFKGTNYIAALNKAYEFFLEESGGKKVILIVGDLASHGFKNSSLKFKDIPSYNKDIIVLGSYFGEERKNSFIKNAVIGDKSKAELAVRFINDEKNISRRVTFAQGKFEEDRLFDMPKSGERFIKFILPEKKQEAASYDRCGSISLKEDNLSIDDKFFYAFEKPAKAVKTLLLYDNPRQLKAGFSAYFLKNLLNNATFVNLKLSDIQRMEKRELKQYRLIIYIGQKKSADLNENLKSFVSSGGKLWLIPSSLGGEYPRGFAENYGLKTDNQKIGRYGLSPDRKRNFFKKNNFAGFELDKIKIKKFFNFVVAEKNILWRFSDEKGNKYPALIWKKCGLGAIAVFTSSFDIAWSDIALKPVFADFVFSFIKFFAFAERSGENKSMIYIGERFKIGLNSSHIAKIRITGPRNKIYFEHPQNGDFIFERAQAPGIYHWTDGEWRDRCFAVNIDRRKGESSISLANTGLWRTIGLKDPLSDFKAAVYGAQLWQLLFLICVLLFIAEGILSEKI